MKQIVFALVFFLGVSLYAQDSYTKEIQKYQYEQNIKFHDKSTSPLTANDLKKFESLDFFKINKRYQVVATLTKTKNPPIFEMATTTDRKPLYVKYGMLGFTLDGKKHQLPIYQNKDFGRAPQYKNYLFLPFSDTTNGKTTYGGGRYLDVLTTDENKDGTIIIDFNKAYNPYCAYSGRYSCPITPKENALSIPIKAGVKAFKK